MQIRGISPLLFVPEIEPCLPFWTERLGFEVRVKVDHGERIGFALLGHGAVQVMLQTYASLADDLPTIEPSTRVCLYVDVDDLAAVERAMEDVEIVVPRRTTFYGAQELGVREPGGNVVLLAQHEP